MRWQHSQRRRTNAGNVLLDYQGSEGFDKMPWTADGKTLWDYLKMLTPTILSSAKIERLGESTREKCDWCARELGEEVPVIVVPTDVGKWPYAREGAVLIDDSPFNAITWQLYGGLFVLHTSVDYTIALIKELLAV